MPIKYHKYLDELDIKDFVFFSEPVFHPLSDYDKAIADIRKLGEENDDMLSVYTFGEITDPGISDLDLIFVLKENGKIPRNLRSVPKKRSFEDIICHPFFFINRNIMENMQYIYPTSKFKLIYGEEIKIKDLNTEGHNKSLIYLSVDFILRHIPGDYLNILLSKRINLRSALLRLKALTHSISVYKDFEEEISKEWIKFSEDVFSLRKTWFEIEPENRKSEVIRLLKKGVYISYEIAISFAKLYGNINNKDIEPADGEIIFKGTKERISFIKDVDIEAAIDSIISHFNKFGNYYSIIPIRYLKQLCSYAALKGPLSEYINENLSYKCDNIEIDDVLKRRIELLNEQVEIAIKLKHKHYPCFFPLGYKNTAGFENKLRFAAIKIINNSLFRKLLYPIRRKTKLF